MPFKDVIWKAGKYSVNLIDSKIIVSLKQILFLIKFSKKNMRKIQQYTGVMQKEQKS